MNSPKQPDLSNIDPLLQGPLFAGELNNPTAQGGADTADLGVGDTDGFDGLWDFQDDSTVPDLPDICSQSPASASASVATSRRDGSFDFGPAASNVADATCLFAAESSWPQHGNPVFQDFSPSAIVRSYPSTSAKSPNRDIMSIPQPLNSPSWTLIEYYFKEVAALYSSYDSQMNPYRTTVSRIWGSSLAMCRTMQSMAAATLVNDFPQFGPMGLKMRDEAIEIITKEAVMDDKSLLALLMLGQTASWHNANDLGISFFNLLRKHLNTMPAENSEFFFKNNSSNYRFFEESLVYWEMLLSFVADDDALTLSGAGSGTDESLVLQRVPHPWTGIARDVQFTVQEVGRLVRRERKRVRTRRFTSQEDIEQAQLAIEKARGLEGRFLNMAHPNEAEIVSPGDDDTPVWHLLTVAEVFRCVGLMQLYRVFPDLLRCRLPSPNQASASTNDNIFPDPIVDSIAGLCDSTNLNRQNKEASSDTHYDNWLTEFSITTLSRLKTIPQESRTRCLQPFLLIAASSELRLPPSTSSNMGDADGADVSSHAVEVMQSRKFILGRLNSLVHVLPPKPIELCILLAQEVWKRLDAGEPNVYWMDVMIEKGWETIMG